MKAPGYWKLNPSQLNHLMEKSPLLQTLQTSYPHLSKRYWTQMPSSPNITTDHMTSVVTPGPTSLTGTMNSLYLWSSSCRRRGLSGHREPRASASRISRLIRRPSSETMSQARVWEVRGGRSGHTARRVRSHGREGQTDGAPMAGQVVEVVEDVISAEAHVRKGEDNLLCGFTYASYVLKEAMPSRVFNQ